MTEQDPAVADALAALPTYLAGPLGDFLRRQARANGIVLQGLVDPGEAPASIPAPVAADPAAVVLATAHAEWLRGVVEPGTPGMTSGASIIDGYIRGPQGLGWPTCDIKTWKPGVPYTRNGAFQWCGAFAAFCWGAAGLSPAARYKRLPGTPRLLAWARGTDRLIRPADLRPGDIAVVGPQGDVDGEHIVIVRGVNPGDSILTYEGNAKGPIPSGAIVEGVISRSRPFFHATPSVYRVLYGVRPLAEDMGP
jgi:hypothetical protein